MPCSFDYLHWRRSRKTRKPRSSGADDAATPSELRTGSCNDAKNFTVNDQYIEQQLDGIDLRAVDEGSALNMLGLIIRNRYYTDNHMSKALQGLLRGL